MISVEFDYQAPTSIETAINLLRGHPQAQILAGGHTLIAALKDGKATPSLLVDLAKIPGLQGIKPQEQGGFQVGGMTTYDQLASNPEIQANYPAIAEALQTMGDPQIRNWGRVGDVFAYQDLARDLVAVTLALGATFETVGIAENQTLTAAELVDICLQTDWFAQIIITAVNFPPSAAKQGNAYQVLRHPASNVAICGVAVWVELSDQNIVSQCRVAQVGVTSSPLRLEAVERAITGQIPTLETILAAAALAPNNALKAVQENPSLTLLSDFYASADYRTEMLKVLTKRSLISAIERAGF